MLKSILITTLVATTLLIADNSYLGKIVSKGTPPQQVKKVKKTKKFRKDDHRYDKRYINGIEILIMTVMDIIIMMGFILVFLIEMDTFLIIYILNMIRDIVIVIDTTVEDILNHLITIIEDVTMIMIGIEDIDIENQQI